MHLGIMYTTPTLLDLFKYINEEPASREVFEQSYQDIIASVHRNTMQPNVDVHLAETTRIAFAMLVLDNIMDDAERIDADFTARSHNILGLPPGAPGASLAQILNARPLVTPLLDPCKALDCVTGHHFWIEKCVFKAWKSAGPDGSLPQIRRDHWEKLLTDLVVECYFDHGIQAAENAVSPLLGQMSLGKALCEVLIFG